MTYSKARSESWINCRVMTGRLIPLSAVVCLSRLFNY